jgi:hypothetical protein
MASQTINLALRRTSASYLSRPSSSTSSSSRSLLRNSLANPHLQRHYSSKRAPNPPTPPKTTLAKPDRYRPPSHPPRVLRSANLNSIDLNPSYGPSLTAAEKAAQSKRQYPNMMPPEGTFLHWFLTSRGIHVFITLGTLTSLTVWTLLQQFRLTSPYASLLPSVGDWFKAPLQGTGQIAEVIRLHTQATTDKSAAHRKRALEDVSKRSAYRKEHGIAEGTLTSWLGREDNPETTVAGGPVASLEGDRTNVAMNNVPDEKETPAKVLEGELNGDESTRPKRKVKRWFGIWE